MVLGWCLRPALGFGLVFMFYILGFICSVASLGFALKSFELVWRPTLPGNEDVLICINAPYMTQRVLKPWWQWTYQNFAVKRAPARAIPGWVTSWEVWYGEPKADNIVSLGVGRYKWYQSHCPAWDGGSVHKPKRVAGGHLLGCQEWVDPMRVASKDAGSKGGVIVTSHIAWEWGCAYMYKCTLYDTTRFKAVMTMNLSELRS
jgi:hypothetical protein